MKPFSDWTQDIAESNKIHGTVEHWHKPAEVDPHRPKMLCQKCKAVWGSATGFQGDKPWFLCNWCVIS